MDYLLAILFSVTLLIATSPPREMNEGCDYSGGFCTMKGGCSANSTTTCTSEQGAEQTQDEKEGENDCGKKSDCPFPICCVCGPCCCLCIVPERPVIQVAQHALPIEERIKPNEHQDFLPQQVYLPIWKPPSISV